MLEGDEQMNMFDEAETESDEKIAPEEKSVKIAAHTRKAKATHKDTFEGLPVEEVVHPVEDRVCPGCGAEMETVTRSSCGMRSCTYPPRWLFASTMPRS